MPQVGQISDAVDICSAMSADDRVRYAAKPIATSRIRQD
jgi:hypothetical protein